MKPIDTKKSTYVDFNVENNDKVAKIEVGDHVRVSKCKNMFAKGYVSNWSEEVFVVKKVKNTVSWTNVVSYQNGEEIVGTFYKKTTAIQLQKTNQIEFGVKKVIRKKKQQIMYQVERL